MFGAVARSTYVLVLGAMIVAWVFSLNRDTTPAGSQPSQVTWSIYA